LVDQGIAKAKELAGSPQATQAVGGLKNYLSGFAQSPMKWGAGQWGGLGAGAVLAYLLSRKNDKEKDDQE
jgi:hypothetical protein